MADEQKLACNRTPFETTDSCDRGDVDILTFSDLPLCNVIDPPRAKWGPPTFDFPVVPFAPPPCVCINIDAESTKGTIEARSDFIMKMDFKAKSDCCEGNYEASFDVKIPCITFEIQGGSDSYPVNISEFGCTDASASPTGTFTLGMYVSSCDIKVNPSINIQIPRYPRYSFSTKMNMETICGLSSAVGSLNTYSSGDSCNPTIVTDLYLKIPRPPIYMFEQSFNIETICGLSSALMSMGFYESGSCDKKVKLKMGLKIPKPPVYTFEQSFNIQTICGISSASMDAYIISSGDSCEKRVKYIMDLTIPKPPVYTFEQSFAIDTICGLSSASGSMEIEESGDSCEKNVKLKLHLVIPKPPIYTFEQELNIDTVCGLSSASGSMTIEESGDSCEKNIKLKLDLLIPKPPKYTFDQSINIETVCGLSSAQGSMYIYESGDSCDKNVRLNFDLKVPKPPKYEFEVSTNIVRTCRNVTDNSTLGSFWITDSAGGSCEHKIKSHLNIEIPCIQFDVKGANSSNDMFIETRCDITDPIGVFNLGLSYGSCCSLNFHPTIKMSVPAINLYKFKNETEFKEVCDAADAFKLIQSSILESVVCDAPFLKRTITRKLKVSVPHIVKTEVCDIGDVNFTGGLRGDGFIDMGVVRDNCDYVTQICPMVTLDIPCPLDALTISAGSTTLGGWSGIPFVGIDRGDSTAMEDSAEGCTAHYDVNLVWPDTYTGVVKFLKGIKFNGASFVPIIGWAHFEHGLCVSADSGSPEVDIPTSRHVNKCCEVGENFFPETPPDNGDAPDGD